MKRRVGPTRQLLEAMLGPKTSFTSYEGEGVLEKEGNQRSDSEEIPGIKI